MCSLQLSCFSFISFIICLIKTIVDYWNVIFLVPCTVYRHIFYFLPKKENFLYSFFFSFNLFFKSKSMFVFKHCRLFISIDRYISISRPLSALHVTKQRQRSRYKRFFVSLFLTLKDGCPKFDEKKVKFLKCYLRKYAIVCKHISSKIYFISLCNAASYLVICIFLWVKNLWKKKVNHFTVLGCRCIFFKG